ncbi:MAG: FAD binding domain-containing protein [Oligoflexia bacterium]|nr:FAD binding domain-containing protein [Oligoflexia bacterium]
MNTNMKNRDYVLLYVNGERKIVKGENIFLTMTDYLRDILHLTGTKIVCAEGDCGACTVLKASISYSSSSDSDSDSDSKFKFEAVNSCIASVHLFDCSQVVTVEGLRGLLKRPLSEKREDERILNPIQNALVTEHGSQCGFCTPGIALTMTEMFVNTDNNNANNDCNKKSKNKNIDEKEIKNCLTGNLCRCTGYQGIINAGLHVANDKNLLEVAKKSLDVYQKCEIYKDLEQHKNIPIIIESASKNFYAPTDIHEAINFKVEGIKADEKTYVFSSATDLGVQINKDFIAPTRILSLNSISNLYEIKEESRNGVEGIILGAKVSLSRLQNFVRKKIPELYNFLFVFASPQIKNMGTIVGNVANASPIGDTLPFLLVMDATLIIQGQNHSKNHEREVKITEFFKGYKKYDLAENELITHIFIPIVELSNGAVLKLYKVSKRKDLDISTINAAYLIKFNNSDNKIEKINISYGGVAATPLRLKKTENYLLGKVLDQNTVDETIKLISSEISPISDVRGHASYRNQLAINLFKKFYCEL